MVTAAERHRREGEIVPESAAARQRRIDRAREREHGMPIEELRALAREVSEAERPRAALQGLNRDELYTLAQRLDVSGRSKMNKPELIAAVAGAAASSNGGSASSTSPGPGRRSSRTRARRRPHPPSLSIPRPVRRATKPIGRQFLKFLGAGIGLVALYVALENADTFAAVAGLPGRILRWLGDPTASIPYVRNE